MLLSVIMTALMSVICLYHFCSFAGGYVVQRNWLTMRAMVYCSVSAALSVILGLSLLLYWYRRRNKPHLPNLYHKDSDLLRFVLSKVSRLNKPFMPCFWLQNGHIHTIFASMRPTKTLSFHRQYFDLSDGGALALDWVENDRLAHSSPVIIVLPGLTGGADSVSNLCEVTSGRAYRTVVFNKRGHGDSVLVTPKLQGFGDPSDLRQVIEHLTEKYEHSSVCAIGISAGSGLLASYLGEYGNRSLLTCAVGVCPGYDAVDLFFRKRGIPKFYELLLLSSLKQLLKKHDKVLSEHINMDAALNSTSFVDFDRHVYCKLYGYNDPLQYWQHNNPMKNVRNISTPFLCISSLDDPVCIREHIPFDLFLEKEDVLLVTTKNGGHCGFLEDWGSVSWADHLAVEYVDAVLEFKKSLWWCNVCNFLIYCICFVYFTSMSWKFKLPKMYHTKSLFYNNLYKILIKRTYLV